MTAKLTKLTHKIAIQLHLVAKICIICISRSRRPVWKLWIHPRTYMYMYIYVYMYALCMYVYVCTRVYPKVSGQRHNEIRTNTHCEATQRIMAAKLTRLAHKIAVQLHLVAESCTIYSSCSRRPVRKVLDTHSYVYVHVYICMYICIYARACVRDSRH
jgi:hypothetical protein